MENSRFTDGNAMVRLYFESENNIFSKGKYSSELPNTRVCLRINTYIISNL